MRRQELQRWVQLGYRACPKVSVGAQEEGLVVRGRGGGLGRHVLPGRDSARGLLWLDHAYRRVALSVRGGHVGRPDGSGSLGSEAVAGGALAVLPADSAAADLLISDAVVEGDSLGEGGEG